ncbi:adhesion G-protein coupled receptor G2 isoform X6 [Neoarius graeffei]|uniref:adhesion G-protein coupled receptor G2 isoform X6 n=1 Tax=Neoarius graeffei TaxID=443677 RepID=UPI00298C88A4|nr:adhesion G-protein coupled receptor G2 isoform X6 [Neoarius graeffei]
MVSTSLFVMRSRPQRFLDHVLLSVVFLLSHIVAYTITTNATTTAPTGGQEFLSVTKNTPIAVPSTVVMNTSSTTDQIITSGTNKPANTSEVNITPTATTTPLVTAFANATNVATVSTNTPGAYINTTNTTLPVTASFNATTALWPVHCNFSQNCGSVYYWMTISVEVNGSESNESDISAWVPRSQALTRVKCIHAYTCELQNLFQNQHECRPILPTITPLKHDTNSTSGSSNDTTTNSRESGSGPITTTVTQNVSSVTTSLFNTGTLGNNSVSNGSETTTNIFKDVTVVCDNMTAISNGNSETAYVSLANPDQMNCTFGNQPNSCNCSSSCNSTAAYYSLETKTADFKFNMTQILTNSTCNITNLGCQALKNISQIYENSTVTCKRRCTIIVKLSKAIDVCLLHSALLGAFQNQSVTITDGTVTRVAICSWKDSLNADLLQSNIMPVLPLPYDVCQVEKVNIVSNYCKKGTNIAVPLREKCNKNPVNSVTTSMPKSTANTHVANITTTISATNTLAATLDATASTVSSTSEEVIAEGLLNLSRNASSLNSTQIKQIVSLLESLLSGPTVSLALGNLSINIVSNLIDAPPNMLASISNRIIGIVDTVGLKLVVQGKSQSILSPSVALAVKLVDGALFPETTFTITDDNLQIGSRLRRFEPSSPRGSITLPASLTENLTPQQQQLVSRVQFNFYQKTTLFQDKALNLNNSRLISGVLGSSVANMSISNLRDQIVFTLMNTETVEGNSSRLCVFWKFNLNGGSGGWSSEGCTVLNHTETETICGCNHLTSFGVLLDLSREGITNRLQATILTYITYIGCGISAIFLSVTLMTYLAFETLRKDIPSKIVIQLCLALLLLNLTFLLDAWLALYPSVIGLCISTAFFLHYFLLASFTWMAMEAVHMYIALVKVFNTYVSRFMVKLGLAGWGIPLIVVIIVISIEKNNYGLVSYGKFEDGTSDQFCWLKNDIAFYVAVVAYFCVVFLLNLSMFIVVMVQLCRIKRQNPHNLQHRSVLQDLRSVAGLTVLLGLTWGFAFFAWDAVNLPFMYLFAIFNSLQGFFIFVFHCAVKENVRRQWRIYLCCGNLRKAEKSDWSHTATQRTKKSTVNRVASSFRSVKSSNNSSSSFLVSDSSGSDRSMGIGSPLDDHAITEQEMPSSDVVLNELNHRYRSQRSL